MDQMMIPGIQARIWLAMH